MLANYFGAKAFASGAKARFFGRLGNRFLYLSPSYLRYLSQTVVLTPWAVGLIALYILAFVPQMREVYIGVIEDRELIRGILGLASLSAFTALLYHWNHEMVTRRIDGIYPGHADIYFDRRVIGVRDVKAIVASALPLAGLFVGVLAAHFQVLKAARHVKDVAEALSGGLDQAEALQERLNSWPAASFFSLAVIVAVSAGVLIALHLSRNDQLWPRRFNAACYALTALLIAGPIFSSDITLKVSRLLGPLAGTGLVLIAGAIFMRIVLGFATQLVLGLLTLPSLLLLPVYRIPFALRQLIVVLIPIALIVFAGVKLAQFAAEDEDEGRSRTSILEELAKRKKQPDKDRSRFAQTFASWLKARELGSGEYPVFVVTAEGGGIYAASAAALFLAKMQERCPDFAEHVFAVSAVSGGSVGASLFNAALAERAKVKDASRAGGAPAGCLEPPAPGELFERLRKITRDDHLSPVIAYILPDLVRDLRELFSGAPEPREPCKNEVPLEWFGRDHILEKSFIASFDRSKKPFTTVCPNAANANPLMRTFSESWQPAGKLPALLLNATWVETGYRVAFSPFPLQHLGQGTLYSFDDVGTLPGRGHEAAPSWQNPSLIGAAAVSARFPFIMPPWASNSNAKNRWTFVDGGYADSSGVTTGLELYNELQDDWKESTELKGLTGANGKDISPAQVKFYLIALTDAYAEPDYRKITGSALDDFVSPVNTLLTVRELLARRAVTWAYSQLGDNLITVQLDQQSFRLSLGWKISALTSDIIRFVMGRPDRCNPEKANDPDWAVWTVNHNSCQLKRITDLLTPAAVTTAAHTPAPVTPAPAAAAKTLGPWQLSPQ